MHHTTVAKVKRLIAANRIGDISPAERQEFYAEYATFQQKRAITLWLHAHEGAEASAVPVPVSSPVIPANPADDIIHEPPGRYDKKDGWFYSYGVYIDLFRAGLLTPDEDPALAEVLQIAQQFNTDLSFNGKIDPPETLGHYHALLHALHDTPVTEAPPWDDTEPAERGGEQQGVRTSSESAPCCAASRGADVAVSDAHTHTIPAALSHTVPTDTVTAPPVLETALQPITPMPNTSPVRVKETQYDIRPVAPAKDAPSFGSEQWDGYVMSLLRPSEVSEIDTGRSKMRCPRNPGLRRILQELIGPITDVSSDIQCIPDRNNRYITIARVRVYVKVDRKDHPACGQTISWQDFGNNYSTDDASNDIVVAHPATSAQTSAESRCFKKILGLSGVYAAEEMVKTKPRREFNPDADTRDSVIDRNKPIDAMQVQFIENMCKKHQVKPLVVASHLLGRNINALTELDAQSGRTLQAEVNKFNYDTGALAQYREQQNSGHSLGDEFQDVERVFSTREI